MSGVSLSIDAIKPLNRWDNYRIRPGPVGSVGMVNCSPRLKHSFPDAALRWYKEFSGEMESRLGSNITDGTHRGYVNGGGLAKTVDSAWGGRRNTKTQRGWKWQDLRAPDKRHEPSLGSTPHYSWNNKLATVFEAKRTGSLFLPLPGGYGPEMRDIPRGGQVPYVTDVLGGNLSTEEINDLGVPGTQGETQSNFKPSVQKQELNKRLGGRMR